MVEQKKFATDLDFIESLPECGKFVLNDWDKLRKDLERFIEAPDNTGKDQYPIRDLYAHFMDIHDISPKFATTAILFLLSSCTRLEQVIVTKQGDEHLNLWCITIGQSTIMRKTRIDRKIRKLLKMAGISLIPSKFTTPAMFLVFQEPNNVGALVRGEFSGLLSDMDKEHYKDLPEALCELYDCEPEIVRVTRTNKTERIENPYVTYWTSTQPANFELFTNRLFGQGYLMRYLYCMELEKWVWYDRSFDPKPTEETMTTINGLLQVINTTYITTVVPSRKTVAYNTYQDYCKKIAKKAEKDVRSIIYSYYGRVEEFVLKIAGILEIARSAYIGIIPEEDGEIPLTDDTLDLAVRIVRMYEQEFRKLIKEVRAVAQSDPVKTDRDNQQYVLNAITKSDEGVASIGELIDNTKLPEKKLRAIVKSLETAGTIIGTFPIRNAYGKRGNVPRVFWINRKDETLHDLTIMTAKWLKSRDNK